MRQPYKDFLASKQGSIVLSLLAGILRGVYFIDRPHSKEEDQALTAQGYSSWCEFGIPMSRTESLNVCLGWKREALERIDDVADRLIEGVTEFCEGDRESFSATMRDSIQQCLPNTDIFYFHQIYGSPNVFSLLRSTNPMDSAKVLLEKICEQLLYSLSDWLTIFPLSRVQAEPFYLGFDGISLINPSDEHTWEAIGAAYSNANNWYQKERKAGNPQFNYSDATWLLCEQRGTPDGARQRSARRMRSFIAVMLSVMQESPYVLMRVAPDHGNYVVQFPTKKSASGTGEMHASIGPAFPAIAGNISIQGGDIARIREWYIARDSLAPEVSDRYTAASQFANYALNADGLERFIYFFITLDALFGERGRVEEKIREGILRTFPHDPSWQYKIGRLFDLRSSIVHGGCVAIAEWEKTDGYKRHTKTSPEDDVATAAMTALLSL